MDAELVALATSGATTLVGLLVTDGWNQARERFAALLSQTRGSQEAAEAELDHLREELMRADQSSDDARVADTTTELKMWLRRALENNAELSTELLKLVNEYRAYESTAAVVMRDNNFHGSTAVQGNGVQTNRFGV
ncbi:hypothetical protein [Streptomyces cyaneofuscatus]|uniref:hypothetical protein n=1 Tax=Streptomyces cyaneofuscatus TaxID=66883 RepID=UPI0036DEBBFA